MKKRLLALVVALIAFAVCANPFEEVNVFPLGVKADHARACIVRLGGKKYLLAKYTTSNRVDPWQEAFTYSTDSYKISLFDFETNKALWTKDLGMGIPTGDWFCPILSFDIDNDGDDEIFFVDNNRPQAPLSTNRKVVGLRAKDGKPFTEFPIRIRVGTPSETYRFVMMGGKGGKDKRNVIIIQNGTYKYMDFDAYDVTGKCHWSRTIGLDGTPRATHCAPYGDFDGDGYDEVLWGARLLSFKDGKDIAVGTEDGWDAHSDIDMPIFDRNLKFIGFWDCREGKSRDKNLRKKQFRCNLYDNKCHILWGKFKVGHMDRGGVFRLNAAGDKGVWVQEEPGAWTAKDRKKVPAVYFDLKGNVINYEHFKTFNSPPRPIDVDGDGRHEFAMGGWVYTLEGKKLGKISGKPILLGHVRDDLPGEQGVRLVGDRIVIYAYKDAKWSKEAKKRYAHPYYHQCLQRSAIGYNWAYDLAGL